MTDQRQSPIDINNEEFRKLGYQLIDTLSEFMNSIRERPVTLGESPKLLQKVLGKASLPEQGTSVEELLTKASSLLIDHSLFNGHPRFLGYITSSPAPIGALADLLAAVVNSNVGAQILSPIATEIEKQTVKWLAELIGVSPAYGGLLVSGGNMANFTAFLAGRTVMAPKSIKEEGVASAGKLVFYCSKATHTWVEKAAVLFGLGTRCIRWITTDTANKINTQQLDLAISEDTRQGFKPFMVIGNAGDVSTGAIDDLKAMAAIAKAHHLWFHIDGAYGIPAAAIPEWKKVFEGMEEADSIALDPHKWLYSPLEAGCTLLKEPDHLVNTYSSHPVYYNFNNTDDIPFHNFYEYGLQNSRGFRALKVWLALQQVGKTGYIKMIRKDIQLSKLLFELAKSHPELEAVTQSLSITTLRYVPIIGLENVSDKENYLNELNETLLNVLQKGGEVFLSNAMVGDKYCLRACIVNFRTSEKDIKSVIEIIAREGQRIHVQLQQERQTLNRETINI